MKKIVLAVFLFAATAGEIYAAKKESKSKKETFVQINLNTAEVAELVKIPGISKAKAQRIVEARPLKSVDDLKNISHITKSGKESFDFATSKGAWQKNIALLIEADIFTTEGGSATVDEIALYKKLFPNPVDINTATLEELTTLPGISKAKAQRIIEGRPYSSIDDLKNISHTTKSGKESFDFATSKGEWQKAIKPLIESGRLVCGKAGKEKTPAKKPAKEEEPEEDEWSEWE